MNFSSCWTTVVPLFCLFMDSTVTISMEEFQRFHSIDRTLYAIMVYELWRDPVDAMKIMALWLWLERAGFHSVVHKILSLPIVLINELADEATTCISLLNDACPLFSSETMEIPLTHALMEKEISLQYFRENQSTAVRGMTTISKNVCVKVLGDIMKDVMGRNAAHLSLIRSIANMGIVADDEVVRERPREVTGVHPDDRTMFVTFSKGYPVAEWEVRDFFTRIFGDCIESLYMQEVDEEEQALFARIVFYIPDIIDMILNGVVKAKFTINGKHVWMRKFVPKRPRTLLVP